MPEPPTRSVPRSQWARIDLPRSASSVGTARRFIEARVSAWSFPRRAAERLVLIGSELVTNAVLHARTDLTLTLELEDGRARISVKDQSQAPATLRHYRADALTGRGLGVVAALSDSWGISAAADGKVVWAEVATDDAGDEAPRPPELRNGPAPAAAELPGTRPVRFPEVPVETYLELQAHNDALLRELELISIELEAGSANPAAPLAELVDQLYRRFRGQRDSYRDVVAAAKARGQRTVDLQTSAPPAAAGAAQSYLDLLERADELCRAGLLLTPEPPAPVRELRRWFVAEMVAQLRDGATPTLPPGETVGG
ncbi:MAG TPA: ATP-binding protein [Actinomycetota bacterium]|jgi:anti-sigma regulatory factor (Ser/Thr protein kinase)|nr:ATP-binding protein [Actinomycetota bacterium]